MVFKKSQNRIQDLNFQKLSGPAVIVVLSSPATRYQSWMTTSMQPSCERHHAMSKSDKRTNSVQGGEEWLPGLGGPADEGDQDVPPSPLHSHSYQVVWYEQMLQRDAMMTKKLVESESLKFWTFPLLSESGSIQRSCSLGSGNCPFFIFPSSNVWSHF